MTNKNALLAQRIKRQPSKLEIASSNLAQGVCLDVFFLYKSQILLYKVPVKITQT